MDHRNWTAYVLLSDGQEIERVYDTYDFGIPDSSTTASIMQDIIQGLGKCEPPVFPIHIHYRWTDDWELIE